MTSSLSFFVLLLCTFMLSGLLVEGLNTENEFGPAQYALMAHHHIKESKGALNQTMADSMDKAAEAIAKADKKGKAKGGKAHQGEGPHGKGPQHMSHGSEAGKGKGESSGIVKKETATVENKKSEDDMKAQGCISGSASNPGQFDWSKYAGTGGQSGSSGSSSGGAGGFDWSKYVPGAGGNEKDDDKQAGLEPKRTRSKQHLQSSQNYYSEPEGDEMPEEDVAATAESLARNAEDLAHKFLAAASNLREAAMRLKQQSETQDLDDKMEEESPLDKVATTVTAQHVQNTAVAGSSSSSMFSTFILSVMLISAVGFFMFWIDRRRKSSYEAV